MMSGVRRAVFASDLHLGSNPTLDDFTQDVEFESFLELPELTPSGNDRVELVLLGDSFDLWQAVSDGECHQEKAKRIDLAYVAASEAGRLDGVRAKHLRWFQALGRFAERPGCRLVVVPGNHDHSLIDPTVQARLAGHLGLSGSDRLSFVNFYENPMLRLYADHGNQYDHNNTYDDFARVDWSQDCRGYYFVKLFLNRIEYRDPRIDNSPSGWGAVWHWLRRTLDFTLLATAIRYFWQYSTDDRVPKPVTPFAARGVAEAIPQRGLLDLPAAPQLLVSGSSARSAERFFSADTVMEEFLREAYDASPEVRLAVNEILEAQEKHEGVRGTTRGTARRGAPRSKPSDRGRAGTRKPSTRRRPEVPRPLGRVRGVAATRGIAGPPEDVAWAENLFSDKPYFRDRLTPGAFQYVLFGHTHGALEHRLSNGAMYLNTGTWTTEGPGLPVAVAECPPGGTPTAKLFRFKNGRLE